ncbi:MAG: cytochrome P450 [Chloroflexi bacterium]|nr:cytochrome P450 [Chloroflexota bacterium]
MTAPAPAFNPGSPEFLEDPYPFYKMGQAIGPIWVEQPGIWLAFGYDEITAILKDHATWSSGGGAMDAIPEDAPPPGMLFSDPPRHTRLRSLVSQAFTPRMIEQLEPRIAAIADELVSAMAQKSACDLVEELAYPLPVIVIAEILGVPAEDRAMFKKWSDEVVSTLGGGFDGQAGQVPDATFEAMREYFTRMADARRAEPRADLISGLVRAEIDGARLSFDELLQMLVLLLVAGNETTTNLIGNAVLALMEHPDQLHRIYNDPSLLPSAIEEVLRFSSPVQATARVAMRDTEVSGRTVRAGQQAVTWLAAANRDARAFPDPDTFDVGRAPNRHLAFGLGIHFCLGAPLARMEARIALGAFLAHIQRFRRADDGPLPRVPTFIMRGVRSLPITYRGR